MTILYTKNKEKHVVYHKLNAPEKKAPFIIFHHGLMSDMNGSKTLCIEDYCKEQGYNFIRFDNFGHGDASGKFTDQTITTWLEGLNLIIDELTDQKVLLIGSSMGAWITTLCAITRTEKVLGMVGISAAVDFTEDLIWNNFSEQQKEALKKEGIAQVTGSDPDCDHSYPINYDLILDARKHLLLDKNEINLKCPLHLIHGMMDADVPHSISQRIFEKVSNNQAVLKLVKDGNHNLSRDEDLHMICNSIDEILSAGTN